MIIQITQGIYLGAGGTTRAIANKINYLQNIDDVTLITVDENPLFDKKLVESYRDSLDVDSDINIINLYDWLRRQRTTPDAEKFTLDKVISHHFEQAKISKNEVIVNGRKVLYKNKLILEFSDNLEKDFTLALKCARGVIRLFDAEERPVKRIVLDTKGRIYSMGSYNKLFGMYQEAKYFNYDGNVIAGFINKYNDYFDNITSQESYIQLENKVRYFSNIADMEIQILEKILEAINPNSEELSLLCDETSRVFNFGMSINKSRVENLLYMFHSPHWKWEKYDINIPFNGIKRKVLERQLHPSEKIIVLSKEQKEDMLSTYSNLNSNDIHIVDNFLNLKNEIDVVANSEESINVVSVGRLSPEKNVDIIIKAFDIFTHNHKNSFLHIIGSGKDEVVLKDLVKKLGLDEKVNFYGNQAEPWSLIKNIDFSVNASDIEGYGLIFPESISRGIPVVAWNSKYGAKKWIKPGINGLLSDRNVENLAKKFEELYSLNLDHKDVQKSFDNNINEKTLRSYRDILK